MKELIRQIVSVRDTGLTNMFDVRAVRLIAENLGLTQLADFIASNPIGYFNFVLTGDDLYLGGGNDEL